MVTLLIEAGSPVESADEFRLTPLHIAAKHGHQAAAQRLCSVGADLTAQTHDGHTPLALALQARDEARMAGEPHSGLEDTIRLLRGRGARELSPCADGSKLPSDLVLDCGFPPAKVSRRRQALIAADEHLVAGTDRSWWALIGSDHLRGWSLCRSTWQIEWRARRCSSSACQVPLLPPDRGGRCPGTSKRSMR